MIIFNASFFNNKTAHVAPSSVNLLHFHYLIFIPCRNSEKYYGIFFLQRLIYSVLDHVLSFYYNYFSSGSRSGVIHHHDVRQADHLVGQLSGHTQEVCGLKWSPDGRYLASGGNDNLLQIWQAKAGFNYTEAQPQYTFTQHQAAVKALAWCPWQPSLLASGGGTADRHIRFWNCNTGSCVSSVDTKSQVFYPQCFDVHVKIIPVNAGLSSLMV